MSAGNAIIARVGLDTRGIAKETSEMEKGVTQAAQRANRASSRLAAQNAKVHEKAAADIEKAYRESSDRIQKATDAAYASANKSAAMRQAATTAEIKRTATPGASGSHSGSGGHGGGGSGGHAGGGLGNTRAIGDILDNLTGTKGWGMKANIAAHFTRVLPALALGMMVKTGVEDQAKLKGDNDQMDSLLGRSTTPLSDRFLPRAFQQGAQPGATDAHATDALHERRDALGEQSKKLGESRTFFGSMVGAFGGGQTERSFALQRDADAKRAEIDATIAGRIHDQIDAKETLLHKSQFAGELAQHELEAQEKLNKLRDQAATGKIGLEEYRAGQVAVAQDHAAADDESARRHEAKMNEIDLEKRLTYIRQQGDDESTKAAYAKLDAAKEEMGLARTDEERAAAAAKINAAELEWSLAQKTRDIEAERHASALKLAGLRGSADERHLAALGAEADRIAARLADPQTTPDEKKKLIEQRDKNAQATDDFKAQQTLATFDVADTMVDARSGRGQAAQREAAREHLFNAQAKLRKMQELPQTQKDPKALSQQEAKVNELQKSVAEMDDAKDKAVRSAKAETTELEQQLKHHEAISAALKTQFEYDEKIRQARRDNPALVPQLQKQKDLSFQKQAQSIATKNSDKFSGTLAELAAHAFNEDGRKAREAIRLQDRSDRERQRGHKPEAERLGLRAEDLKRSIGALKSTEKDVTGEVMMGIQQAAVLQDMLTELKKLAPPDLTTPQKKK